MKNDYGLHNLLFWNIRFPTLLLYKGFANVIQESSFPGGVNFTCSITGSDGFRLRLVGELALLLAFIAPLFLATFLGFSNSKRFRPTFFIGLRCNFEVFVGEVRKCSADVPGIALRLVNFEYANSQGVKKHELIRVVKGEPHFNHLCSFGSFFMTDNVHSIHFTLHL